MQDTLRKAVYGEAKDAIPAVPAKSVESSQDEVTRYETVMDAALALGRGTYTGTVASAGTRAR